MGGVDLLVRPRSNRYKASLNDCLADHIKSDSDFIDGIRRGLKDCKEGRVKPWSQIKQELGIG
ncbi:hypothetical protein LCGC14_0476850 [marine sediment metagenome]|uniref:Uncharacterized protein n=1 Tax=marine sediment metagenome TaxID=412755 RepID=A0A0F9VJ69_9ZZZZ